MIVVFARSLSAADPKSGRYSMVGDHLSCRCQSGSGIDFIGRNSRSACYPGDEHIGANDMIAVSRELTRRARARTGVFATLPLTDDFVAVVCSPNQGKDGEEWLRRCVDEPLLSALFPHLS